MKSGNKRSKKLPAFQFYPGDWRKDPGIQALTYHDRGVWLEILCLMHESEQRGYLLLAGKPVSEEALARMLGMDEGTLRASLKRLLAFGVASKDEKTRALMCRRMVRDEALREKRTEAGYKGGNPILLNQKITTQVKQKITPSSSSSISSSSSPSGGGGEPPPPPPDDDFSEIPTAEEVVSYGRGPAGIPPGYCRNFHDRTTEKRLWRNRYGRVVDWRKQLVRFWAGDRASWREPGRASTAAPGRTEAWKADWLPWLQKSRWNSPRNRDYQFAEEHVKKEFWDERLGRKQPPSIVVPHASPGEGLIPAPDRGKPTPAIEVFA